MNDGDLAVTSLSLKFAVTVLRTQPAVAGVVCEKVRTDAVMGGWRLGQALPVRAAGLS